MAPRFYHIKEGAGLEVANRFYGKPGFEWLKNVKDGHFQVDCGAEGVDPVKQTGTDSREVKVFSRGNSTSWLQGKVSIRQKIVKQLLIYLKNTREFVITPGSNLYSTVEALVDDGEEWIERVGDNFHIDCGKSAYHLRYDGIEAVEDGQRRPWVQCIKNMSRHYIVNFWLTKKEKEQRNAPPVATQGATSFVGDPFQGRGGDFHVVEYTPLKANTTATTTEGRGTSGGEGGGMEDLQLQIKQLEFKTQKLVHEGEVRRQKDEACRQKKLSADDARMAQRWANQLQKNDQTDKQISQLGTQVEETDNKATEAHVAAARASTMATEAHETATKAVTTAKKNKKNLKALCDIFVQKNGDVDLSQLSLPSSMSSSSADSDKNSPQVLRQTELFAESPEPAVTPARNPSAEVAFKSSPSVDHIVGSPANTDDNLSAGVAAGLKSHPPVGHIAESPTNTNNHSADAATDLKQETLRQTDLFVESPLAAPAGNPPAGAPSTLPEPPTNTNRHSAGVAPDLKSPPPADHIAKLPTNTNNHSADVATDLKPLFIESPLAAPARNPHAGVPSTLTKLPTTANDHSTDVAPKPTPHEGDTHSKKLSADVQGIVGELFEVFSVLETLDEDSRISLNVAIEESLEEKDKVENGYVFFLLGTIKEGHVVGHVVKAPFGSNDFHDVFEDNEREKMKGGEITLIDKEFNELAAIFLSYPEAAKGGHPNIPG